MQEAVPYAVIAGRFALAHFLKLQQHRSFQPRDIDIFVFTADDVDTIVHILPHYFLRSLSKHRARRQYVVWETTDDATSSDGFETDAAPTKPRGNYNAEAARVQLRSDIFAWIGNYASRLPARRL